MFLKRKQPIIPVIEVEKPVYIEKIITVATIPPVKRIAILTTKMSDVYSLYTRLSARQHEEEWKITRCYDVLPEYGIGTIYVDIPTDKAHDTVRFLASEYGLPVKVLHV